MTSNELHLFIKKMLHFKSAHLSSLNRSTPYSQTFCISGIFIETKEMIKHLAELKSAFLKRGYQEETIDFQFNYLHDLKEHIHMENKGQSIQTPLI